MGQAAQLAEAELLDVEDVFDDDYLYFYGPLLTRERTQKDADTLSDLLALKPGASVLDIGCGHGRIANTFARRGYKVTGIDRTPAFLALARRESDQASLDVDYVEGDMRSLPWRDAFDAAYIWFTTFGYFEDEANQQVLARAATTLKAGGRLVIEQINRARLISCGTPHWNVVEVGSDLMIDKIDYDPLTDIAHTVRTIVRDGVVKRSTFAIRLYTPSEITNRMKQAGFGQIEIRGQDGAPFTLSGNRMIAIAEK